MKKVKAYIYVRDVNGKRSIGVSSEKYNTTYCCDITGIVSAPICETEVQVPDLDDSELTKILSGSLLSVLIDEREKIIEQSAIKLKTIDQRIADLKCIEYKGDSDGK